MKSRTDVSALIASADALLATDPPEAARRYAAALLANPANITAHNALEQLKAAQAYGHWMHVNCVIDPRDDIFLFFSNHETAKNPIREYLSDGWRTLSELMVILETIDKPLLKTQSVLEFAAGFGRFTRHLVRVLPGRVTCADVMPGSVEFLQTQFGVKGFVSAHDPATLAFPARYDLVFVLSMFTHLPPAMWQPWLKALGKSVAPGGVLVFSVHNESDAEDLGVKFDENGVRFLASSESPSLDAAIYGTTYTTRDFAEAQVALALGTPPSAYFPNAFWSGQDGVVVQL